MHRELPRSLGPGGREAGQEAGAGSTDSGWSPDQAAHSLNPTHGPCSQGSPPLALRGNRPSGGSSETELTATGPLQPPSRWFPAEHTSSPHAPSPCLLKAVISSAEMRSHLLDSLGSGFSHRGGAPPGPIWRSSRTISTEPPLSQGSRPTHQRASRDKQDPLSISSLSLLIIFIVYECFMMYKTHYYK